MPSLEDFVLDATQEHCTKMTLRNLLPCIVLRDLILPTLSSLRALSPAQPTKEDEVLKLESHCLIRLR